MQENINQHKFRADVIVAFRSNVTIPLGITNKSDNELPNIIEMFLCDLHSKMLRKITLPAT